MDFAQRVVSLQSKRQLRSTAFQHIKLEISTF